MLHANWKNRTNLLCIRLDNMGDVIMSQPAMRALKGSVPGRKITLLTSSAGAAISPFIPEVDEIIAFDVPWVKETGEKEPGETEAGEAGKIRGRGNESGARMEGGNGAAPGDLPGDEKLAVLTD